MTRPTPPPPECRLPRRLLFVADDVVLGDWHCYPDDPDWDRTMQIGDYVHVVLPATAVRIEQDGKPEIVATRNATLFYNARQLYRRRLLDPHGDHCLFLALQPDLVRQLGETLTGSPELTFDFTDAPLPAGPHLVGHAVARLLRRTDAVEDLSVHERLLGVVHGATSAALAHHGVASPGEGRRRPSRPNVDRARREIVEEAKAVVASRLDAPMSLAALAAHVHVSPYHLARLFRSYTGYSVHEYATHLRLRSSLPALAAGEPIATVARRFGFSSHAHFTRRFTEAFGVPPSAARGRGTADLARLDVTTPATNSAM